MGRVVVVGSGIAGLVAAITASAAHHVTLVTKSELAESNTRYAQGGIAAATSAADSASSHSVDTLRAGGGLNDSAAVDVLTSEGPELIQALLDWGVEFDRDAPGTDIEGLARALEAAHSHARVLHAGGDATGAAIQAALVRVVRASQVRIREHLMLTDLIVEGSVEGGRVAGIRTLDAAGVHSEITADAVILATGGAGQLFAHTTNPAVATGDGVAAAIRAGVAVSDLEFYQFHPTTLALEGNFLLTEALRGEGAVLLNAAGERFMTAVHPDAELAPRDVVARAIAAEMARQGGLAVHLDTSPIVAELGGGELGAGGLRLRFPTVWAECRAQGLDLARDLIRVTPAAHYWMGGIDTDLDGRTNLPGLLAVGECARTGVHGANRLASNSLLEGAVFGRRAALAVWSDFGPSPMLEPAADAGDVGGDRATRAGIQELMWEHCSLTRTTEGLAEAAAVLASWSAVGPADALSRDDVEVANLLVLARGTVAAASARNESVGAHYREPAFSHLVK